VLESLYIAKSKIRQDLLMIIGDPDISYLNEKIAELEKRLKREINITAHCSEEYKAKKKAQTGCGKIGREALYDESYARARRSTI